MRGSGAEPFSAPPDGTETVLYAFAGENDGTFPNSGVIGTKPQPVRHD